MNFYVSHIVPEVLRQVILNQDGYDLSTNLFLNYFIEELALINKV